MGQKPEIKSIARFDHCYGCGVCSFACPQHAISMEMNSNGFFSPVVGGNCNQCSLCLNVCAFNSGTKSFKEPLSAYVGWSKNESIRDNCTSGGVVFELCSEFITQGYKVCAVKYNYEDHRAEHFIFDTVDDLYLAAGSKYLQSYTADALSAIDLKNERYVIVGTPCMISSMRTLAKIHRAENKIILIDFFCHGVPSYLMWNKYLKHVKKQVGNISSISWRNKDNGWQESKAIKAKGELGRYLSFMSNGDLFFDFFLKDRCLNECCFDDCIFKLTNSDADIRVGDMWSREPKYVNNRLGVNSILALTPRGQFALNTTAGIHLEAQELQMVLGTQLKSNPKRPVSYNYVKRAMQKTTSLLTIEKKASLMEYYCRFVQPNYYKTIYKRILQKLFIW